MTQEAAPKNETQKINHASEHGIVHTSTSSFQPLSQGEQIPLQDQHAKTQRGEAKNSRMKAQLSHPLLTFAHMLFKT